MVSLQSSAKATSQRFRMAHETLARAQPIKMRECSKLVTRLLFREYRFNERFLRPALKNANSVQEGGRQPRTADAQLPAEEKNGAIYPELALSNAS